MNANELADELENYCYWTIVDFHFIKEAATMLRQLKADKDLLFKAHSHEMVRADKLQIEVGALKEALGKIK